MWNFIGVTSRGIYISLEHGQKFVYYRRNCLVREQNIVYNIRGLAKRGVLIQTDVNHFLFTSEQLFYRKSRFNRKTIKEFFLCLILDLIGYIVKIHQLEKQ